MRKLFCNHSNCRAHVTIIFTGCWLFTDLRNERWRRMEPRKWIRRCETQMVPPAAPSPLLIKSGADRCRNLSRWVDSTVFWLCSGDHARRGSETQDHHAFQASSPSVICRSSTLEAMRLHRVTPPANGPHCDLIAKLWLPLFSPYCTENLHLEDLIVSVTVRKWRWIRTSDSLVPRASSQPLCSVPCLWPNHPFSSHFSPCEFQRKQNPYVFYSFALNSSKYDFERVDLPKRAFFIKKKKALSPWKTECLLSPKS